MRKNTLQALPRMPYPAMDSAQNLPARYAEINFFLRHFFLQQPRRALAGG